LILNEIALFLLGRFGGKVAAPYGHPILWSHHPAQISHYNPCTLGDRLSPLLCQKPHAFHEHDISGPWLSENGVKQEIFSHNNQFTHTQWSTGGQIIRTANSLSN
jgi:hypothetical protein